MPYVNKARPYKKEYEQYHSSEEQKENRARRNRVRRNAIKNRKVTKGDGKDIDHKKPISKGGSDASSNLRVTSKSSNRSYPRQSNGRPR